MSNFFAFLLRIYSFVFHLALCSFLIALAALDYHSQQFLNLDLLPFSNENLVRNTLLLGAAGLGCTLLALTRTFKFLFVLWTALAAFLMLKWLFLGDYLFDDAAQRRGAAWLTFGAAGAFIGAAWSWKTRRKMAIF